MKNKNNDDCIKFKRPERRLLVVAGLLFLVAGVMVYTISTERSVGVKDVEQRVEAGLGSGFVSASNGLNYHAIVIGINEYGEGLKTGWKNLKTAVDDAEAVGNVLEEDYGFNVHRLINQEASLQNIITTLDRELVALGPSDAALIYFAGHGQFDEQYNEGYWVPYGTPLELDGRMARERWIPNTLITEILEASAARHILVIADSCYSGSLFSGEEKSAKVLEETSQYVKAIQQPSRVLITSGSLEPVLDGVGEHSVFASQLLDFLAAPPKKIFSASELGALLREEVNGAADQRVRFEGLGLTRHKGGEFIFSMRDSAWPAAEKLGELKGAYASASEMDLSQVLLLHRSGAQEAARKSAEGLEGQGLDSRLEEQLNLRLGGGQHGHSAVDLSAMIERLEQRVKMSNRGQGLEAYAKPRVVAWLGPLQDKGYRSEATEVMYQFALDTAFLEEKGFSVMARSEVSEILESLNLGSSGVADTKARLALQKVIPAGILLVAQLVEGEGGNELFVKAVDVQTAETLAVFRGKEEPGIDEFSVAQNVVSQVAEKLRKERPLEAGVLDRSSGESWQIGLGLFHGAYIGMEFALVRREETLGGAHGDFRDQRVGKAVIAELSEMSSAATIELDVEVAEEDFDGLRLVEVN